MATEMIKALSVRQPWASLIASGQKTIETRTWAYAYRGPLLICASKSPRKGDLPTGQALCIVDLIDCRPMTKADEPAACCEIYERAWSWVLANVRPIPGGPFPVSGKLGPFNVELPATGIVIPAKTLKVGDRIKIKSELVVSRDEPVPLLRELKSCTP